MKFLKGMMNYQRIYDEIINNAKSRGLNKKLLNYYTERHHIVPKCLNGTNDKSNLVLLTGREHYLCHWLLWKLNKNKSTLFAFYAMLYKRKDQKREKICFTSKQYEILRIENNKARKNHFISENGKRNISIHNSGVGNPFFNKTHTEIQKQKWKMMRKGSGNPRAKDLIYQNLYFPSLQDCVECYNSTRKIIGRKLKSQKYKDCFWI